MLLSLNIQNVALIHEINMEFSQGLNVLTGETGAGKSILIDALGVILGNRVSTDLIRHDEEALKVEGSFLVPETGPINDLLNEWEIPLEEDHSLLIVRKINRAGKNTVWLNGNQIPVSSLKRIGVELVAIHGQHDTQEIFSSDFALKILDQSHPEILTLKEKYQEKYRALKALEAEEERIRQRESDRTNRLEMLTWQIQELSEAQLNEDEENKLEAYVLKASNTERIASGLGEAYERLNGDTESILSGLFQSKRALEQAARFDSSISATVKELENVYFLTEEIIQQVRESQSTIDFDPFELERSQKRLDVLYRLKKKYNLDIPELKNHLQSQIDEKQQLEIEQVRKNSLTAEILAAKAEVFTSGNLLSEKRSSIAREWGKTIQDAISSLAMPDAKFEISQEQRDEWTIEGQDRIEFLFSANIGQPLQPLRKVASGGELSRVALALKSIAAQDNQSQTLIFDEVDTGIGGKTALAVGEKMRKLAEQNQLLTITHLPQIASFATRHFHIAKNVLNQQTLTEVSLLDPKEQIDEIARMLAGDRDHETARKMAQEMLLQNGNSGERKGEAGW